MTRIAVDLVRLADTIDRMVGFERRLTNAHDDVTRRVAQVQAAWAGDAADAQAAAQHEWAAALAQVHAALAELRSAAAGAHANYVAAVAANRRMWAQ